MGTQKELTLRLEAEIIEQAERYAREHGTSVSKLVSHFFARLRDGSADDIQSAQSRRSSSETPITDRLIGILAPQEGEEPIDARAIYKQYIEEKYG